MFKIFNLIRSHRRPALFFCDMLLWNLSYYISFVFHLGRFSLEGAAMPFLTGLAALNLSFAAVFCLFRLYNKMWRYADTEDFFYAAIASLAANIVFMASMIITGSINRSLAIHSSVYIINALMSTLFVILFRIIYRLNKILERRNLARKAKKRLMIVGAGEGALSVLSELSKTPGNEYIPVCIVDDNQEKLHRRIAGVDLRLTDVRAALAASTKPILFAHGEDDPTVPFTNGERLYALYEGPKDCLFVPGARHMECLYRDPKGYAQKLGGMIENCFSK